MHNCYVCDIINNLSLIIDCMFFINDAMDITFLDILFIVNLTYTIKLWAIETLHLNLERIKLLNQVKRAKKRRQKKGKLHKPRSASVYGSVFRITSSRPINPKFGNRGQFEEYLWFKGAQPCEPCLLVPISEKQSC